MQTTSGTLELGLYDGTDYPNISTYNQSMQKIDAFATDQNDKNAVYDDYGDDITALRNNLNSANEYIGQLNENLADLESEVESNIGLINDKLNNIGLIYSRFSTVGLHDVVYTAIEDSLVPMTNVSNDEYINISNNILRFKKTGIYRLTFNIKTNYQSNTYNKIGDNPAIISEIFSRFRLIENAVFSNYKYINGTTLFDHAWMCGSTSITFDLNVTDAMLNSNLYPVLSMVGDLDSDGYELSTDAKSCKITIEKLKSA